MARRSTDSEINNRWQSALTLTLSQRERGLCLTYRTRVGKITMGTPAHCRRRCNE